MDPPLSKKSHLANGRRAPGPGLPSADTRAAAKYRRTDCNDWSGVERRGGIRGGGDDDRFVHAAGPQGDPQQAHRRPSLPTYAIFAGGVLLWLVFGILTKSWPVIAANVVTLPLVLVILGMKIRCG